MPLSSANSCKLMIVSVASLVSDRMQKIAHNSTLMSVPKYVERSLCWDNVCPSRHIVMFVLLIIVLDRINVFALSDWSSEQTAEPRAAQCTGGLSDRVPCPLSWPQNFHFFLEKLRCARIRRLPDHSEFYYRWRYLFSGGAACTSITSLIHINKLVTIRMLYPIIIIIIIWILFFSCSINLLFVSMSCMPWVSVKAVNKSNLVLDIYGILYQ